MAFWGKVIEGYILCGWNKLNINAMMDWYKRRKIPTTGNGATHANATNGTHKTVSPERFAEMKKRHEEKAQL